MLEIIDYKPINKGALASQFTVKIKSMGDMLLRKCKLFEKDGSRWVSLPAEPYEKDGQKKYYSLVSFADVKDYDKFCAKILETLDKIAPDAPLGNELPGAPPF